MNSRNHTMTMTGGLLAAFGASVCCAGPLVVLLLGLGGSWVTGMTAFSPYQPVFVLATIAAFGWVGWQLHRPVRPCAEGDTCANPEVDRRRKIVFWLAAGVALTLASSSIWIPWLI